MTLNGLTLRMALIALTLFGGGASGVEASSFRIVSDIDDTLLVSHVEKKAGAVLQTLKHSVPFAGTAELLTALSSDTDVDYVSGSGELLRKKFGRFIESGGYPSGMLFLQDTVSWIAGRTATHKQRVIQTLMSEDSRSFLFIGDDTERDPEIYDSFRRLFPERVAAIYIHAVSPRVPKLPASTIAYFTPVEVAILEASAGRFSDNDVLAVFNGVHAALRAEPTRVFPLWAHCPGRLEDLPGMYRSTFDPADAGPYLDLRRSMGTAILAVCAPRRDTGVVGVP